MPGPAGGGPCGSLCVLMGGPLGPKRGGPIIRGGQGGPIPRAPGPPGPPGPGTGAPSVWKLVGQPPNPPIGLDPMAMPRLET